MRRLLSILALLWFLLPMVAAQTIGTWQVYPSYWTVTQHVVLDHCVYSLSEGNLLRYDKDDTSIRTYDCLNDLNDVKISRIAYCEESKQLILVYSNSNIDLMDADDNIVNLSALKDKVIGNKEITNVMIDGKIAYLCTGFGFVEVDTEEGIFLNTYQMGLSVNALCKTKDYLYAGTTSGLYRIPLTANWHEMNKWEKINDASFLDLIPWDDVIIGRQIANIYRIFPDGKASSVCNGRFNFIKLCDGILLAAGPTTIVYSTAWWPVNKVEMPNTWNYATLHKGTIWVSEGAKGLRAYKKEDNNFVQTLGPIQPNSPVHNLSYHLSWVGNRLLVSGGINTVDAIYNPATAMYYEDGTWTNLQEMEAPANYKGFSLCNTTHLVQDPNDPNHHFSSPYRTGLCEYRDGKFVKLYNCDNSPIRSILPTSSQYFNFCSCAGLQYDSDGNLWMLNNETKTIIRILHPNGKWSSLYYAEIDSASLCDQYLMHSSGLMFVSSRRMSKRGVFCFDTKGTLANQNDDRHRLRSTIVNQDGTNYNPNEFYCLAEDLDGKVWVGTDVGPFVINNPEDFFSQDFCFEQVKVSRNDGSGLADYLLNGVSVNCITVDDANRKWIGTHTDGLYLISDDGQEMIHHFTADNSPLLSNCVQDVAVNPADGTVMIATDAGLCSYVSDATEAEEQLEKDNILVFPNPVKPDYTGPIAVRGLTRDSEVKILSTSGQLVWSGNSAGGTFTWNGCNREGRRVASGVYHVVASNAEGKKSVVTRIVMIR